MKVAESPKNGYRTSFEDPAKSNFERPIPFGQIPPRRIASLGWIENAQPSHPPAASDTTLFT